jgi:CheY-like chemotaxis protein
MRGDARLNLLLTPPPPTPYERGGGGDQPWHRTLSQLLMPLGVRTFEATNGPQAMELMERHPIHLAVVDTRLPAIGGLNVLQLMQRLREHGQHAPYLSVKTENNLYKNPHESRSLDNSSVIKFDMKVEERSQSGLTQKRIEVRFEARMQPQIGPIVILIAPPPAQQDKQLLREALKFNAFSVLSEPVDVEVALEVLARAMKRWFSGQWPT